MGHGKLMINQIKFRINCRIHEITRRISSAKKSEVDRIEPLIGKRSRNSLEIILKHSRKNQGTNREIKLLHSILSEMEDDQQLAILIPLLNPSIISSKHNSCIDIKEEIWDWNRWSKAQD